MILASVTMVIHISCIKQWRIMGIMFFWIWIQDSLYKQEDLQEKVLFFHPYIWLGITCSFECSSWPAYGQFREAMCFLPDVKYIHFPARIYVNICIFLLLTRESSVLAEHQVSLHHFSIAVSLLYTMNNKKVYLTMHPTNVTTCYQKQSIHGISGVGDNKKPLGLRPSDWHPRRYFTTVGAVIAM